MSYRTQSQNRERQHKGYFKALADRKKHESKTESETEVKHASKLDFHLDHWICGVEVPDNQGKTKNEVVKKPTSFLRK